MKEYPHVESAGSAMQGSVEIRQILSGPMKRERHHLLIRLLSGSEFEKPP